MRALCEVAAQMLSKNMTCARPRCNATPSEDFPHTSHCTLHTPHFTLHTCTSHSTLHLIAKNVSFLHLILSHPISSHVSSKQVLLNCFHLIRALINLFHLFKVFLNSSQLFCTPEISDCQREVSRTKKRLGAETFCAHKLEKQIHLHRKSFTKYFELQSLHKALPSTTNVHLWFINRPPPLFSPK